MSWSLPDILTAEQKILNTLQQLLVSFQFCIIIFLSPTCRSCFPRRIPLNMNHRSKHENYMKDEVFRVKKLQGWDAIGYQRFGRPCCLHLQGYSRTFFAVKTQAPKETKASRWSNKINYAFYIMITTKICNSILLSELLAAVLRTKRM
jgi:hypothetical protein